MTDKDFAIRFEMMLSTAQNMTVAGAAGADRRTCFEAIGRFAGECDESQLLFMADMARQTLTIAVAQAEHHLIAMSINVLTIALREHRGRMLPRITGIVIEFNEARGLRIEREGGEGTDVDDAIGNSDTLKELE